ncbi:peptide ABC transporter ATP-binding protein [Marinobacterium zhoushanense]|uniref:Peptide ABC transporter ATP-binding protein n=1 Tax=Marinobacterium zhoushanense TaxID=1679163 RepID=A0ABQ1KRX3_9GAMM|nr:DMT family transporter [Marinobacterium zhoushanense]GGC08666.1 peptide ABC transporter ATP-binding protein [Marinobacterium zhoushanense]
MSCSSRLKQLIPLVFVLLWSTGFIGARFGLPYIEPFNFLFVRMLLTLVVFAGLMLILRSRWPNSRQALHQMVVGTLVHAGYLGGVFAAIRWQMPAGVTSLIVGLQPLLTAVLAWLLWQQRLRLVQWCGLVLGLLGVVLVLQGGNRLNQFELAPAALIAVLVALGSISVGTLYQKRFGQGVDLVTGSFFQYLATAIWMGMLTWGFETGEIDWQPELIGAMAWLVLGLSVSAILLLMLMIREGESARVASYFYLVPPVTAVEAWWLFDERLGFLALCGVAVTVAGVFLVLRPQAR